MRSLLISGCYFPPQVGGISVMMTEICSHFGGQRIAVLTGVAGDVSDDRLRGVHVYRAGNASAPGSLKQGIRPYATLALALARERPTVLQYATLEDAHMAYWTHRALRMKHILYAHGNEILHETKSSWAKSRVALLASSCVIANSRYTAGLLRGLGVPDERIRIVHPGCDLERFRPVEVDASERARLTGGREFDRLLLSVGNLVERKGHDTVIQALARLGDSAGRVLYLIAGDGPYRPTLERLAESLGVADRVVFLGRVAGADLPLLYSMADVFIMVSRERADQCDVEGFGIVFIEAAACGTTSVGGRSGGVEDAIADGETGLLVEPGDAASVAHTLGTLLSNRDLVRRLGNAARRRAVAQFSWAHFGTAIDSVLHEIARQRSAG